MGWFCYPSFFFFGIFFKIKYVIGHFGKKKKKKKKEEEEEVKVVELPQFESLGGLSVTFKTLNVKVQISG
jgi:hypothetical protein